MEKSKKIIIYGIGKLAEYVSYVFENDSEYEVVAFCVEENFFNENQTTQLGLPILIFENISIKYDPNNYSMFIAVGNNDVRERIYNESKAQGYSLANYISSKAETWPNLIMGDNTFIGEGSTIQPFVALQKNVIMFSSNIGHHCNIGNHILISGGYLAGNVTVGDYTFIGLNATINQNVIIGKYNIIGVGSNISKNTQDDSVYTNSGTIKRTVSARKIGNMHLS